MDLDFNHNLGYHSTTFSGARNLITRIGPRWLCRLNILPTLVGPSTHLGHFIRPNRLLWLSEAALMVRRHCASLTSYELDFQYSQHSLGRQTVLKHQIADATGCIDLFR